MAVIPPDSWADMGLETSGISMTAVPPLVWDNVLKVLAIGSATAAASGVVSIIGQQFSGIKEFMAIPKCALVCSAADDIPNKAYVDTLVKGISWQDEVVQFIDLDSAPPPAPANGDRYIQTVDAGLFTHDRIYEYQSGSWLETIPDEGYAVYVDQGAVFPNQSCVYNGTDWVNLGTSIAHASLLGLANDDHTQYVKVSGRIGDIVSIPNVTASSSTTTGALTVTGGIGCSGQIFANGFRSVTTGSGAVGFQSLTPALAHGEVHIGLLYGKTYGSNLNCAQALYYHDADGSSFNYMYFALWGGSLVKIFNNRLRIEATTASTTITSGALEVMGGIGCSGQIFAVGVRSVTTGNSSIGFQSLVPGISAGQYHIGLQMGKQDGVANDSGQMLWFHTGDGSAANYMYLALWGGSLFKFFNNRMAIEATTASTSLTTGALTVAGGLGVSGGIFSGNITVLTANGTLSLENNQAGASRRTCYMQWDQTNSRCAIGTWNGATSGADYPVDIIPTLSCTAANTGALRVAGGCSIAENLYVGGTILKSPSLLASAGVGKWIDDNGTQFTLLMYDLYYVRIGPIVYIGSTAEASTSNLHYADASIWYSHVLPTGSRPQENLIIPGPRISYGGNPSNIVSIMITVQGEITILATFTAVQLVFYPWTTSFMVTP